MARLPQAAAAMRVGINGISVVTGGNITYLSNVLPALARLIARTGDEVLVYTREGGPVPVPASARMRERRIAPAGLVGPRRAAWEQVWLPARAALDRVDVFYGPTDSVPLAAACPTVCAFRNPNIYADPKANPPAGRNRLRALRALALASARKARRAIFVSAATRDDILPVLGIPPWKARVVHHGVAPFPLVETLGPRPWDRPYILMVSTLYDYKNSVRLIEAYANHVRDAGLPHGLAIVGALVEPAEAEAIRLAIRRLGVEDQVRLAGEVPYARIAVWYRHAAAFAFPSWKETFGHPLVEAMAADLPIAASDIPVMREIGGSVPVYFDPFSADDMGRALAAVLDEATREDRVARGRVRREAFTWDRCAELTLETCREATSRRRKASAH